MKNGFVWGMFITAPFFGSIALVSADVEHGNHVFEVGSGILNLSDSH